MTVKKGCIIEASGKLDQLPAYTGIYLIGVCVACLAAMKIVLDLKVPQVNMIWA